MECLIFDDWAQVQQNSAKPSQLNFNKSNNPNHVLFVFLCIQSGQPFFYELGASPLSALPLGPEQSSDTFRPKILYAEGQFRSDFHNFGHVVIAVDGTLIFRIVDKQGVEHYKLELKPTL